MTLETSLNTEAALIRDTLDGITNAVRAKDVDAFLAYCAPDIVTFDLLPPLEHRGKEAVRGPWATAMAPFQGPVEYDVRELDLVVHGDAAFSFSLVRFGGTGTDGERIVNWLRTTLGMRKIEGRWKVVHQHVSVPFDMETGKALLGLKP